MSTRLTPTAAAGGNHHFRFHLPHRHLNSVFGNDWFALKAEAFARFFGTPIFLVTQTLIVAIWILLNAAAQTRTLLELMHQNTDLTQLIKELSERIESLTGELHRQVCARTK